MDILSEYKKIRELSRKMHMFKKNISKKVYLHITGGYKFIVEPVEIKGKKFFFRVIGKGITEHPLTSYSIDNVEKIVPISWL